MTAGQSRLTNPAQTHARTVAQNSVKDQSGHILGAGRFLPGQAPGDAPRTTGRRRRAARAREWLTGGPGSSRLDLAAETGTPLGRRIPVAERAGQPAELLPQLPRRPGQADPTRASPSLAG
jgi:hypothetical protein